MKFLNLQGNLLTVEDAAKLLNVDTSRIGVLCRQGRFKNAIKVSRIWLIPEESIKNFTRLPPGAKPKTAARSQDKELIANTLATLQEQEATQ